MTDIVIPSNTEEPTNRKLGLYSLLFSIISIAVNPFVLGLILFKFSGILGDFIIGIFIGAILSPIMAAISIFYSSKSKSKLSTTGLIISLVALTISIFVWIFQFSVGFSGY